MMRKAQKSFAPKSLHIQVEALGPALWITVPSESDPGAIRGESRRGRLSGQSRKRNGSQGRLLLRTLLPTPSIDGQHSKRKDQDSENARRDLHPRSTQAPAAIRFNGND
jgi:hypothetical protein